MTERDYIVTYRESLVVTARVQASSAVEAIELAKNGEEERLAEDRDDWRGPQAFKAVRERAGVIGCPTCGSPDPRLHPAQRGWIDGTTVACKDSWHERSDVGNGHR